jgi:hypothetical protein
MSLQEAEYVYIMYLAKIRSISHRNIYQLFSTFATLFITAAILPMSRSCSTL